MTKYFTHRQHYRVTENSRKSPKSDFTLLANYCLLLISNYGTTTVFHKLQVAQLWQRDRASSINDFKWGVNLRLLKIEELLFAPLRHDAIYSYASYGKQTICSTRPSCWIQISTPSTAMREQHCGRPSHVYSTDQRTKLTALETISRWLTLKKRKNRSLSHPLGPLGITYALHLWLVGKPVVDFILVVIELFSLSPTVETLWAEIGSKSAFFEGGWVTLNADFRGKGASPTNH